MSHSLHPDIHEHGLADGCEACKDAAERPWASLDETSLYDLVDRTLSDRFPEYPVQVAGGSAAARSDTEARAMAVVMTALERSAMLASKHPAGFLWYARERWGVNLALKEV